MMGVSVFQLGILLFLFVPMIHVVFSSRSHGGAKFGWFLAVLFFSWLAYIVFLIVTQKTIDQNKEPHRSR
jgi:putative effector of murein hydrolase LrgA (UPF0299 family)